MNRKTLSFSLFVFLVFGTAAITRAQRGTAPNGYYPQNYSGSIFTGTLESADANTQEIVLTYSKGNKTERFTGHLEKLCSWKDTSGTVHSFGAAEIPKGALLTAFYVTVTMKTNGQKTTDNSVFAISRVELDGKKTPDEKRIVIFCSERRSLQFMAF